MHNGLCRACLHVALEGSNVRASTERTSCSGDNDRAYRRVQLNVI
jgi:hypothetical protein